MKFNRPLFLLIPLAVVLLATQLFAGITGTNLFNFNSYSIGTNTSAVFIAPQAHTINPLSTQFYHSSTNPAFLSTNILQVTFDGGATWANVATYVEGTNNQNETWNISFTTLTPSNRVVSITTTNQTRYAAATWNQ